MVKPTTNTILIFRQTKWPRRTTTTTNCVGTHKQLEIHRIIYNNKSDLTELRTTTEKSIRQYVTTILQQQFEGQVGWTMGHAVTEIHKPTNTKYTQTPSIHTHLPSKTSPRYQIK